MNLIPYKQWATEEAKRNHLSVGTIYCRVCNGEYPELKMERKNQRVIMVPPYPVARIVAAKPDRRIKYDFSQVDWATETSLVALSRKMGCAYSTTHYWKSKTT